MAGLESVGTEAVLMRPENGELVLSAGVTGSGTATHLATDGADLYPSEREKTMARRFHGSFGEMEAGETFAELRTLESNVFAPTDVPVLARARSQIGLQHLDVRAQFILSLVDGRSTLAEIVSTSGMPHEDAMYAICDLTDHGVLKYR